MDELCGSPVLFSSVSLAAGGGGREVGERGGGRGGGAGGGVQSRHETGENKKNTFCQYGSEKGLCSQCFIIIIVMILISYV